MNHTIKKMLAAGMAVVISVALAVTVTYAWTTLSTSPTAEGIEVSIGGGNTILLAPDISKTVNGEVCHYPGYFNDTLIFSRFKGYDYLKELDCLEPVSTADGLNWFSPSYYDITDKEVQNGEAAVGDVKPISSFKNDNKLLNANLEKSGDGKGHYVYLDFWVVSPSADYTLRVSRGDENGGSFLAELPKVEKGESGFTLAETKGTFAASARVGFLANTNFSIDSSFDAYKKSREYNSAYNTLAGVYQEKGEYSYPGNYRFTIYEPNGDLTPGADYNRYVETKPIGVINGKTSLVDIKDRLTVQLKNGWNQKKSNNITLDEMLTAATVGKNIKTVAEAESMLYGSYLQGQFSPYVSRGKFISSTTELYSKCGAGIVDSNELASLKTSGATEDTYIVKLIKNIPQRIRMYVWIEGQDVDCTQTLQSEKFALSIELAGSNR